MYFCCSLNASFHKFLLLCDVLPFELLSLCLSQFQSMHGLFFFLCLLCLPTQCPHYYLLYLLSLFVCKPIIGFNKVHHLLENMQELLLGILIAKLVLVFCDFVILHVASFLNNFECRKHFFVTSGLSFLGWLQPGFNLTLLDLDAFSSEHNSIFTFDSTMNFWGLIQQFT